MDKVLLISVLVATIALPSWAAGHRDPRRGLRRVIVGFCAFACFYVGGLILIYPHLL